MTRERIELNRQDDSANSLRVRPLRRIESVCATPAHAKSARVPATPVSSATADPDEISSRVIDLDLDLDLDDDEAQFLRTQRRVPVRRGPLAKKAATRIKIGVKIAAFAVTTGALAATAYGYAIHAARFRIGSSDDIEISGVRNASRAQIMEIAGSDIGRNVFFVPLEERRRQLERIPWVQSAGVMRLLPNRIAVEIAERTPVAKVQLGTRINLIDVGGVVLGSPANRQVKYSFPVIHGITEAEPLSSRAAVMKIYSRLIQELDSDPATPYSRQLSEVDLSDPEDVKVTAGDVGGTVLVHLGNSDFLERYKLFAEHAAEWRRQSGGLQSVDLRYEGQVIVNPDNERSGDRVIGGSADLKAKPVDNANKASKKKVANRRHRTKAPKSP